MRRLPQEAQAPRRTSSCRVGRHLRAGLSVTPNAPALPRRRRLSELISHGRLVLLFYRGNWCPFCLRQLADYRERYLEIRSAGADVVAVSVDAPDKSEALRVRLSLPFAILCDTERRVVREWG